MNRRKRKEGWGGGVGKEQEREERSRMWGRREGAKRERVVGCGGKRREGE